MVHSGYDSLAAPWRAEFSMVLTNPPLGKSQGVLFVNEEGELDRDEAQVYREDFWTSTSNRQLSFVKHIYTLLRLPTGIRYSPGVKANVIFFDKKEGRAEA